MIYQSGNDTIIESNSTSTKGKIKLGSSAYDEANNRLGLKTQTPSSDLSLGGAADFVIKQERNTAAAQGGKPIRIEAGGAKAGETNQPGGALVLASGIATGSGGSGIQFEVVTPGAGGTADRNPAKVLELFDTGLKFVSGDRAVSVDGATADDGGNLTVAAGDGAGTDKDGGDLILEAGASSGTGISKATIATAPAGSTGATPNAPVVALEIRGDGSVIAGRQAALLAQGATAGFMMIPAVATGDPSGTPANVPTGQVPITFCPVTGKLAVWNGSAWKLFSPDA